MVPHSCIECANIVRISKLVLACRVTLEVLNFRSTIKFNPPLLCLFGRCFLFSREEPWLFVNNSPSSLHQPSWAWHINIKADNEHLGLLRCLRYFQFSSTRSHNSISGDPTPPGSEIYWSQVLKLSLTGLTWCQYTGMISYVLGSPLNLSLQLTSEEREYLTIVNGTGTMGRSKVNPNFELFICVYLCAVI